MYDESRAASKKVLILGDIVVDHYRVLDASRVSPEAPVLIFRPKHEYRLPGGASNVANNLVAMGVPKRQVLLCSVGGQNWNSFCPATPVLVQEKGRPDTVKERLVTNRQQIARIDIQSDRPISNSSAGKLIDLITPELKDADCVVFSDYHHGVMRGVLVDPIVELCRAYGVPTVVDSKAPDTVAKYRGCTIAVPTYKEARDFTGLSGLSEYELAEYLVVEMELGAIGMTLGPRGIFFRDSSLAPGSIYPPLEQDVKDEVVDVTGAGDTVTAAVALGLSLGLPYDHCITMANVAAGIVVSKKGVATATYREISEATKKIR